MIYIYSKIYDVAIQEVINWIYFHYKKEIFRVGADTLLDIRKLYLDHKGIVEFELGSQFVNEVNSKDIESVWYHGGEISSDVLHNEQNNGKMVSPQEKAVHEHLYIDKLSIVEGLNSILRNKQDIKSLGRMSDSFHIKLKNLDYAQSSGLLIPETHIITRKMDLEDLLASEKQYIIKCLDKPIYIDTSFLLSMGSRTELLTKDILSNVALQFSPTLVQEKVEKKYEIRLFFVKGKHFPMAIFSQLDSMTELDFRNYNTSKPNRYVPYKMSEELSEKVNNFCRLAEYDSGSIDLIIDKNGNPVFLEINPFGQFAFLSNCCNYNIEKEIAKYLCNE